MNKEIFLITAYCDTPEKERALKECVNRLPEGAIACVYHHCPVSKCVSDLGRYNIVDHDNPVFPISERSAMITITYGFKNLGRHCKINKHFPYYGFAVMQQIKRGVSFLFSIGYDLIHVINYDTKISKEKYSENNLHLRGKNGVFYIRSEGEANLLFFSIRKSNTSEMILRTISKEDYFGAPREYGLTEGYLFDKFNWPEFRYVEGSEGIGDTMGVNSEKRGEKDYEIFPCKIMEEGEEKPFRTGVAIFGNLPKFEGFSVDIEGPETKGKREVNLIEISKKCVVLEVFYPMKNILAMNVEVSEKGGNPAIYTFGREKFEENHYLNSVDILKKENN